MKKRDVNLRDGERQLDESKLDKRKFNEREMNERERNKQENELECSKSEFGESKYLEHERNEKESCKRESDERGFDESEFDEEELARYFQEAEEEPPVRPPWYASPRFRKSVAGLIGLVLLVQVLSLWPQIFSLDAIRFLKVSVQLSRSEEIKSYKQSVVVIRTDSAKGTGFIVSEDGLVVTNRHVVDEAKIINVVLPDGRRYAARIAAVSDAADLALIAVDERGLPPLALAKRADADAPEPVYLIGNPLFFSGIVNEGKTVGLRSTAQHSPPMLVLDAPVYKGNSGSPVIGRSGEVIGVVYATANMMIDGTDKKVGLAVPVQWVHELIRGVRSP